MKKPLKRNLSIFLVLTLLVTSFSVGFYSFAFGTNEMMAFADATRVAPGVSDNFPAYTSRMTDDNIGFPQWNVVGAFYNAMMSGYTTNQGDASTGSMRYKDVGSGRNRNNVSFTVAMNMYNIMNNTTYWPGGTSGNLFNMMQRLASNTTGASPNNADELWVLKENSTTETQRIRCGNTLDDGALFGVPDMPSQPKDTIFQINRTERSVLLSLPQSVSAIPGAFNLTKELVYDWGMWADASIAVIYNTISHRNYLNNISQREFNTVNDAQWKLAAYEDVFSPANRGQNLELLTYAQLVALYNQVIRTFNYRYNGENPAAGWRYTDEITNWFGLASTAEASAYINSVKWWRDYRDYERTSDAYQGFIDRGYDASDVAGMTQVKKDVNSLWRRFRDASGDSIFWSAINKLEIDKNLTSHTPSFLDSDVNAWYQQLCYDLDLHELVKYKEKIEALMDTYPEATLDYYTLEELQELLTYFTFYHAAVFGSDVSGIKNFTNAAIAAVFDNNPDSPLPIADVGKYRAEALGSIQSIIDDPFMPGTGFDIDAYLAPYAHFNAARLRYYDFDIMENDVQELHQGLWVLSNQMEPKAAWYADAVYPESRSFLQEVNDWLDVIGYKYANMLENALNNYLAGNYEGVERAYLYNYKKIALSINPNWQPGYNGGSVLGQFYPGRDAILGTRYYTPAFAAMYADCETKLGGIGNFINNYGHVGANGLEGYKKLDATTDPSFEYPTRYTKHADAARTIGEEFNVTEQQVLDIIKFIDEFLNSPAFGIIAAQFGLGADDDATSPAPIDVIAGATAEAMISAAAGDSGYICFPGLDPALLASLGVMTIGSSGRQNDTRVPVGPFDASIFNQYTLAGPGIYNQVTTEYPVIAKWDNLPNGQRYIIESDKAAVLVEFLRYVLKFLGWVDISDLTGAFGGSGAPEAAPATPQAAMATLLDVVQGAMGSALVNAGPAIGQTFKELVTDLINNNLYSDSILNMLIDVAFVGVCDDINESINKELYEGDFAALASTLLPSGGLSAVGSPSQLGLPAWPHELARAIDRNIFPEVYNQLMGVTQYWDQLGGWLSLRENPDDPSRPEDGEIMLDWGIDRLYDTDDPVSQARIANGETPKDRFIYALGNVFAALGPVVPALFCGKEVNGTSTGDITVMSLATANDAVRAYVAPNRGYNSYILPFFEAAGITRYDIPENARLAYNIPGRLGYLGTNASNAYNTQDNNYSGPLLTAAQFESIPVCNSTAGGGSFTGKLESSSMQGGKLIANANYVNYKMTVPIINAIFYPLINWVEEEFLNAPMATLMEALPRLAYLLEFDMLTDGLYSLLSANIVIRIFADVALFGAISVTKVDEVVYKKNLTDELKIKKIISDENLELNTNAINSLLNYLLNGGRNAPPLNQVVDVGIPHDTSPTGDMLTDLLNSITATPQSRDDAISALVELLAPKTAAGYPDGFYKGDRATEETINRLKVTWPYLDDVIDGGGSYNYVGDNRLPTHTPLLYSTIWTQAMAKYTVNHIDTFIDKLMQLLFGQNSLNDFINLTFGDTLYSKENLYMLTDMISGLLEGSNADTFMTVFDILGAITDLDLAPLFEPQVFDFEDGDRDAFMAAICGYLAPLNPILEVLLTGKDLWIADDVDGITNGIQLIKGQEGYKNAIIPLLEALKIDVLVPSKPILTPAEYASDPANLVAGIVGPLLDLVDVVLEDPVNSVLAILPNLIYFVNSGLLGDSLNVFLQPIYVLLDIARPIYNDALTGLIADNDMDASLAWLVDLLLNGNLKEITLQSLITQFASDLEIGPIYLPSIDFNSLMVGTMKSYLSKNGDTGVMVSADRKEDFFTALMEIVIQTVFNEYNFNTIKEAIKNSSLYNGNDAVIINAMLDELAKIAWGRYSTHGVIYAIYSIVFYGEPVTDIILSNIAELNKYVQEFFNKFTSTGSPLINELMNSAKKVLDKYFADILNSQGFATNGLVAFFMRIWEFIQRIFSFLFN